MSDEKPLASGMQKPKAPGSSQADSVLVQLDGTGSNDPEGKPLTYRWRQIAGPRVVLSNAADAKPFFRTRIPGEYVFELVVSDGERESPPSKVSVTVAMPNFPPEAILPPAVTARAGETIAIDGSASRDQNRDTLTYRWAQRSGPPLGIDPAVETGPRLTLQSIASGLYEIELVVSDGKTSSKPALCTVRVGAENRPPVAQAGGSGDVILHVLPEVTPASAPKDAPVAVCTPERVVVIGDSVLLDGAESFSPKLKPLRYYWQQRDGPFVREFDTSDADLSKLRFTAREVGTYVFALTVSDGEMDSVPQVCTVRVVAGNAPPVAAIEAPKTAVTGAAIPLDGSRSYDREGAPLTFTWRQTGGPRVTSVGFEASNTPERPVFIPRAPGEYSFELVVSDGQLSSSPAVATVQVAQANQAPSIQVVPVKALAPGTPFVLSAAGMDPENAPLLYEWRQLSGPAPLLSKPARQQEVSLTAAIPGAYVFQVQCSDGVNASPPVPVTVSVMASNRPPRVVVAPPGTATAGHTVVLDASASIDPENDRLSWHWSIQDDSPQKRGAFEHASSARVNFVPGAAGVYLLRVTVNDGVNTERQTVRLIVSREIELEP